MPLRDFYLVKFRDIYLVKFSKKSFLQDNFIKHKPLNFETFETKKLTSAVALVAMAPLNKRIRLDEMTPLYASNLAYFWNLETHLVIFPVCAAFYFPPINVLIELSFEIKQSSTKCKIT